MSKRDYYEVLGIDRGASASDVKKAFRTKAKALHPDRNSDNPNAEAQFKEVNEAYDVLKTPDKKAAYDRYGHAAFEGGTAGRGGGGGGFHQQGFSGNFSDIFEDLFGGGGGRTSGANRGSDLRFNLRITLQEAFSGVEKSITFPAKVLCTSCAGSGASAGSAPVSCPTCAGMGKVRSQQGFFTIEQTCPNCSGSGQIIRDPCRECRGLGLSETKKTLKVPIPKGVENGTRVRLAGEGEAGTRGGPSGDLYIFMEIAENHIFKRDGVHLMSVVPVSMVQAALGCEIESPTIEGGRARVKIPAGSQSGLQLRLRGKGMPALHGGQFGDMLIELQVETPVKLTARQKEILEEFDTLSPDNNPNTKDFFARVRAFWGV